MKKTTVSYLINHMRTYMQATDNSQGYKGSDFQPLVFYTTWVNPKYSMKVIILLTYVLFVRKTIQCAVIYFLFDEIPFSNYAENNIYKYYF